MNYTRALLVSAASHRMRKGLIIFIIANALIIGFLLHQCANLISLLFDDVSRDAILHEEIPSVDIPSTSYPRPIVIPKIIHQTYINESIPEKWRAAQKSCQDLHPDYEYKVGSVLKVPLYSYVNPMMIAVDGR